MSRKYHRRKKGRTPTPSVSGTKKSVRTKKQNTISNWVQQTLVNPKLKTNELSTCARVEIHHAFTTDVLDQKSNYQLLLPVQLDTYQSLLSMLKKLSINTLQNTCQKLKSHLKILQSNLVKRVNNILFKSWWWWFVLFHCLWHYITRLLWLAGKLQVYSVQARRLFDNMWWDRSPKKEIHKRGCKRGQGSGLYKCNHHIFREEHLNVICKFVDNNNCKGGGMSSIRQICNML